MDPRKTYLCPTCKKNPKGKTYYPYCSYKCKDGRKGDRWEMIQMWKHITDMEKQVLDSLDRLDQVEQSAIGAVEAANRALDRVLRLPEPKPEPKVKLNEGDLEIDIEG